MREGVKKLEMYAPKSISESFEYLRPLGVHRVVQWYKLIEDLKNRGYAFDLRFSAEVEEFMKLILFSFSLNTLIRYNVLSLDNPVVRGALHDKDMFESMTIPVNSYPPSYRTCWEYWNIFKVFLNPPKRFLSL